MRLERQTGDEQVVGDGQVEHEAHGGRALGGARQRHDRQRVAERAHDERHQVEDERRVPQLARVYLYWQTEQPHEAQLSPRDRATRCVS